MVIARGPVLPFTSRHLMIFTMFQCFSNWSPEVLSNWYRQQDNARSAGRAAKLVLFRFCTTCHFLWFDGFLLQNLTFDSFLDRNLGFSCCQVTFASKFPGKGENLQKVTNTTFLAIKYGVYQQIKFRTYEFHLSETVFSKSALLWWSLYFYSW